MRRSGLPAILVLFAVSSAAAAAGDLPPVVLSGESRGAASRIGEARMRLAEKKWAEALADLLAVLNSPDDSLVSLDSTHSVQARRICHALIAALPEEGLRLYRRRIDPQANRWLDQALPDRNVRLLRQIVDEAFCSAAGEPALDLLGDLAFERGRFDEAESWWRALAPLTDAKGAGPAALAYPKPKPARAVRARAKQLLARLFRGDEAGWAEGLKTFRDRDGTASGTLAGRTGRYVDLLAELAAAHRKEPVLPGQGWLTFGGNPARDRVIRISEPTRFLEHLGRLCRGGPTYSYNLEDREKLGGPGPAPRPAKPEVRGRSLAFLPVLAAGHVLTCDARHVTAYNLRTGAVSEWYDAADLNGGVTPNLKLPAPADLRYTLTVAEGCVFARLGVQNLRSDARPEQSESLLVCLGLKPGPDGKRLRWHKKPRVNPGKENAVYEGAPVVAAGQVYIAVTRFEGDRTVAAIDCYPAHPEDVSPPTLWRRDLCETRELQPKDQRYRQHLLTLAGPNVVYCSHSGAIVAVDALSGRRAWAVRYPRRKRTRIETAALWRDLAPCVAAGGCVYAAPADSDRLLCLDAATGRIEWEREALDVVHLLGVGQGRVIFTTPKGLRAVGATDGSDSAGWMLPDAGGGLAPMGRGLLVGDLVLWPTARKPWGVFAVRQRDGRQADDPSLLHRVPCGNLAYADGVLAVADAEKLSVFVPPAIRGGKGEKESRGERQDRLLDRARRALAEKRLGDAEEDLKEAARGDLPPRYRLWALAGAAHLWEEAGIPARALAAWQAILSAKALRDIQVQAADGTPEYAATAATAAIDRLRARHGDEVYGDIEKRARQLWNEVQESERTALAERLGQEFPNAAVTRTALTHLARLRGPPVAEPPLPPLAFPLRQTWEVTLGPEERILPLSGGGPAAEWWLTSTAGSITPATKMLEGGGRPVATSGPLVGLRPAGKRAACRYGGICGGWLTCRATDTGKPRWRCALPFLPTWACCHAELILTGGTGGAAALHRSDGRRIWNFSAPQSSPYPGADRISEAAVRVLREPQPAEPLGNFRFATGEDGRGRLFFFQGGRRLFALDAATGKVLWQRWAPNALLRLPPPAGRFFAHYHAGPATILVQTASGRRWLLDAATGRLLHDAPTPRTPWPRPPLALNARTVCLVPDARHVVLLDTTTGKELWTYTQPGVTTRSGEPPQVVGAGDTLLVLTATNLWYELQRLDRATGRPVWRRPYRLDALRLDASGWALDREAVYLARPGALEARSLTDGRQLWEQPLPAERGEAWRLMRTGDHLLAWPAASPMAHFQFRWLRLSVQWKGGPLPNERGAFPLLCCDPRTGRPVQRLRLSTDALRVQRRIGVGPSTVLPRVALGQAMTLDPWSGVQRKGAGLLIHIAGQVCNWSGAGAK